MEGEVFHRGAVQALSDDGQVMSRLVSLVRKELIRPERAAPSRRGRLPLRAPPHTRSGLRRAAEVHRGPSCIGASPTGWMNEAPSSSSGKSSSDTTSSRQRATRPSSGRPTGSWRSARATDWPPRAGGLSRAADQRGGAPLLERALVLTRPWSLDMHVEIDLADAQVSPGAAAAVAERRRRASAAAGRSAWRGARGGRRR